MVIKAADMLLARRADTRARAAFATWKMMAKLNGASSLPAEAQSFLAGYKELLKQLAEPEATEATIALLYKSYYAKMGGLGEAPDVPARSPPQATDNITAFKRPPPAPPRRARAAGQTPASRGADICLPGRGLCRDPVSAAVMRVTGRGQSVPAPSAAALDLGDHRQGKTQPLIGDQPRWRRARIGS